MIAVVGDWITDIDVNLATIRQSPECPCPVVREQEYVYRDGGAGAVVAMVRGMGEDVAGKSIKSPSEKVRYFVDGEQAFRIDRDKTNEISDSDAEELIRELPGNSSLVLLADYGKGVVTRHLWRRLLDQGIPILVDPSRHRPLDWYEGATGIVPNRTEAGVRSVSEAIAKCHQLRRRYPRVCVKLDCEGMVVSGDGRSMHIPADTDEVVDVCGAGDMALAAIGVGLIRGADWVDACRFANRMAGLKCRQHGATPVNPCLNPDTGTAHARGYSSALVRGS